jgi:inorganic pyrophosphatase/exopolyphosphatase
MEKKDEYITRLINLKKGIKNSKTSFLVKDYKEYKIKSIEGLIKSISESDLKYLEEVEKYNNLSEKELDKILNKSLIEVTYLPINIYT